ncbi:MAG: hypothetical protein M1822_008258 [Bathelium mastoideum]|nr:MAG: hypothetical protein M1822_008258 [Bathelium mastoideum]
MSTVPRPATLLPFLYSTPTIRRACWRTKQSQHLSPAFYAVLSPHPRRLQYHETKETTRHTLSSTSAKRFTRSSEYVPFEEGESQDDTDTSGSLDATSKSTLTDEEGKAFARLLGDEQKDTEEKDDIQELRQTSARALQAGKGHQATDDSVLAILQGVSANTAKDKTKYKEDPSEALPPPLRALLRKKRRPVNSDESQQEGQRDERIINRAQDVEYARVDKLLSAAQTDLELWNVLERHVFSRIQALTASMTVSSAAAPNPQQPTTQDPSTPPSTTTTTLASRTALKSTAAHAARLSASSATTITTPPLPTNPSNTAHTTKRTAQLQHDALLALLAPNYPAWLLRAARLLRHDFGAHPSGLTLGLLPRMRSLGVASYAMGASTALYNELVGVHWMGFGDVGGALALLAEMEAGGLEFDAGTMEVVEAMARAARRRRKGDEGGVMWWVSRMDGEVRRARGVEGWRRRVRDRLEVDALERAERMEERIRAEREERERESEVAGEDEGEERGLPERGEKLVAGMV